MGTNSVQGVNVNAIGIPESKPSLPTEASRDILTAVRSLNQSDFLGDHREFAYRRDPTTRRFVIQILEKETGEVVDQIPPEMLLKISDSLGDKK